MDNDEESQISLEIQMPLKSLPVPPMAVILAHATVFPQMDPRVVVRKPLQWFPWRARVW